MIEIKSLTHTVRLLAERLSWTDIFRVVLYCGYKGDKERIPFYYTVVKGDTCVTDLRKDVTEILADMKSNTRNEIRRAEREGCTFDIVKNPDEFINFYNDFCASKGYPDYVSRSRLAKYEKLLITKSVHAGQVLAMHVTLLDEKSKTSVLILSGSKRLLDGVDRKMIGWGNRFLHYKDMVYLKDHGYETYDWSGVCLNPNDPRYSIGQFKLSFGGKLHDSWSLKTPLYSFLEKFRNKLVLLRKS